MKAEHVNGAVSHLAVLLAPTVPAAEASSDQLAELVQSTIRAQNRAAAIRAEALAELRRRKGAALTENMLRQEGKLGRRQARSELETAQELERLPKTRKGLRDGNISYDNARILAGASQRGTIDEDELIGQAADQPPDKFAGTVRRYEKKRSKDDGESKLQHQRSRRYARIKTDMDDGMTVLYGRFDPVTGAHLKTALSKKMNQLWHKEDPNDRATAGQRMADALHLLITQPGNDRKQGGWQGARLLLIADYDTVSAQMADAQLADGTPIPAGELRRLACDAQILPAIFRGRSQPLDLGVAHRVANTAQKTALIARDRKCVGCGASASWCQAHHIIHWMNGGPTTLDNMCLLCSRCHHKVHDDGWQVRKTPDGRYTLQPPPNGHGRSSRRKTPSRYRRRRRTPRRTDSHRRRRRTIKQRK